MKELTKAEEQIMQLLWEQGKAVVKDLIEKMPEPRPAYNTVSTIIRILEKKGFVGHEAIGKTHVYHPLVTRESYRQFMVKRLVSDYFGGSPKKLVSFFMEKKQIDLNDLDEILGTEND
ncbi:MAG: BlaI/MecI/CopY family transcriptional regulator [Bacteroidota bacterium]|nr:BlaI/MecI/CopY family transcriptional regulator [Bacteroidota bacterium]MDX5427313.1 BlaI/MecI/CopY family transcriptional regulator [Bacteroidota bacterium]MDX5447950.1 BlaI/MecI/CopY family transcriptional regulator [Bacteroidota bacterium]MDX5505264.1 BlaI/MecI/CopY family transcriptional regulator [Bacteroidota bacterium]